MPVHNVDGDSRVAYRQPQPAEMAVNGIMLYVDPDGNALGYEDVFSKIAMCRQHDHQCGLGAAYVEQFIR